MPKHDFQPLFDQYPGVIARLNDEFSSHDFLRSLTQQNQTAYVEALYSYRDDAPFRKVHGRLAKQLHEHRDLIVQIEDAPDSPNLFGDEQIVARWRKRDKLRENVRAMHQKMQADIHAGDQKAIVQATNRLGELNAARASLKLDPLVLPSEVPPSDAPST